MTIIIGVDPGLRNTGWGIISAEKNSNKIIDCGVISPESKKEIGSKLAFIFDEISNLFQKHSVEEVVVENIFVGKGNDSAIKLGMARGIPILLAAKHKKNFFEYSPNFIKKTMTGNGHATKEEMTKIILLMFPQLKLINNLKHDSFDAIAAATSHSNINGFLKKISNY